MSVSKFLLNAGWSALAAAMVVTALPATAQDRRGDRGERGAVQETLRSEGQGGDRRDFARERQAQQGNQEARQRGQQAQQRAQQAQQRAAQPAPQAEQRPVQPARQAEQARPESRAPQPAAQAAARQGDWQRGRQVQQPAQQVQQRGVQTDRRGDQRAQQQRRVQTDRRGDQWAQQRQGDRRVAQAQPQGRNTAYTGRSRDNNQWRDNNRRENYQQWDRRWRDNNRYDYNRYRSSNRSIFRIGIYYSPYRNYSYRRLGIGYSLDSLFFGSRYWISDPWQYRLPAVYGPYRWVRYYDDVLLVDIYTGEVVDVIYDFFW